MTQSAPKQLFDLQALAHRHARARRLEISGADFLLALAAEELVERLRAVKREFLQPVTLFSGTDMLKQKLSEYAAGKSVQRIERQPPTSHLAEPNDDVLRLAPESVDLIASAFGLHWCNDLPTMLFQIRNALKPDGLFMAVLPGPGTLHELRDCLITVESNNNAGVALRVDPFVDIRDIGTLMQQAGFALPVIDVEPVTVRYSSVGALMHDLRHMGATCVLKQSNRPNLTRRMLADLEVCYAEKYSDPDGRLRATFSLMYLSGWAPHPDQQKPLKPGSATMRLEDALKQSTQK